LRHALCYVSSMRHADIVSLVDNVPLFRGLPSEQLGELARIATSRSAKRGELIFSEGEEANGFYVVVRGRVKVYKLSPEGKEQALHIMEYPEPFGEVPVFAGGRFPANAQAIEETLLLFFPRSAFVQLVRSDPSLAMNLLALLSTRLRQFAGLVESLSLKEVPGRLASYLVYLSERSGGGQVLELDIPKALLANLLGTIPETLSRILARMTAEGLLDVEGRRITLRDRDRLRDISSGLATL
jgi:CRP/FNR family transcriptional regulator, dissimilatory nitrate respiration regulator